MLVRPPVRRRPRDDCACVHARSDELRSVPTRPLARKVPDRHAARDGLDDVELVRLRTRIVLALGRKLGRLKVVGLLDGAVEGLQVGPVHHCALRQTEVGGPTAAVGLVGTQGVQTERRVAVM